MQRLNEIHQLEIKNENNEFDIPILIKGLLIDRQKLILDREGREILSNALFITKEKIKAGDKINNRPVVSVKIIKNLHNKEILTEAYLI